ncbi:alginate export family protein [Flavobacterium sp.]|uniref:alginate export family protein n=1 Tax=Flavobacterium sp. TaxID=239 RepID=UPI002B4B51EA|nr:alginate export family protein [Flavobacterium sp.]HLP64690.1 alginate export family protein [Flavobacterium sp.]
MKPFVVLFFINISLLFGQQKPIFKTLRYEDDFSYLKTDTSKSDYERLKFVTLNSNGSTYISFGGDVRFQYFNIKNEDWGDTSYDKDGYTLSRYLAHADFHASHFRIFFQLQGSNSGSRVNPNPLENNPLDFHQAFFDVYFGSKQNSNVTFRAGRQELMYGSQRLIAVRELPNNRSAFDGIKLFWNHKLIKSDLFYTHPVVNRNAIFDDRFNNDSKFWGSYTTFNKTSFLKNIDVYYLGLWKREALFDNGFGREIRHSVGTRIWKNEGNWRYDFEGVYQFGSSEYKDIRAWTISSNTSYQFKWLLFKPTFGIKTELISGNQSYDDETLETFNPLFPRGAYFGLAALIGPSNLIDAHPYLNFEMTPKLNIAFDFDIFWRYSNNDGLYAPNMQLIYPGHTTSEKFIGSQLGLEITYQYSNMLFLKLESTWFDSGEFIKKSGAGKDIILGGVTTQFKF